MKKALLVLTTLFIAGNSFTQSIVESNNRFCFDAYAKIKKQENLIFSPTSIVSAMAMTYSGSKENTKQQISNTFYFNKDIDLFNKDFSALTLFSINKGSDVQFFNANSIWIDQSLKLNLDFADANRKYYSGNAYLTDFRNNPEKSRLDINLWVEKNTKSKIKDLIKPSAITNSTRLVLANALYFKGSWDKQFKKENNTVEDFEIGKKQFEKVNFMNNYITSWYYQDKYAEIVDIPYTDDKYSLMIILPKSYKKLKRLEKKLNYDYYQNYSLNKEKKRIKLSIPKFDIESDLELNEILMKMGIKDAFNSSADFSGITTQEKLYISNVLHKAKIIVNEEGTEAAAATAVVMRKTSMIIDQVEFKANRPFIYILRNNQTNCIYFMGKVVNPDK